MNENGLIIKENGDRVWYLDGKRHREDGPAVEYTNGDKEWWMNGKLHRTDGPTIEFANGDKMFCSFDGKHYVEFANGNKEWRVNGKLHRTDGAAIENLDGSKKWYLDGVEYTEEAFNNHINTLGVKATKKKSTKRPKKS